MVDYSHKQRLEEAVWSNDVREGTRDTAIDILQPKSFYKDSMQKDISVHSAFIRKKSEPIAINKFTNTLKQRENWKS